MDLTRPQPPLGEHIQQCREPEMNCTICERDRWCWCLSKQWRRRNLLPKLVKKYANFMMNNDHKRTYEYFFLKCIHVSATWARYLFMEHCLKEKKKKKCYKAETNSGLDQNCTNCNGMHNAIGWIRTKLPSQKLRVRNQTIRNLKIFKMI